MTTKTQIIPKLCSFGFNNDSKYELFYIKTYQAFVNDKIG